MSGASARLPTLLVSLSALAVYLGSARCSFAYDDLYAVQQNPCVSQSPPPPLSMLLHTDFWGQEMASPGSHKSWRPLTVLSYRWEWALTHASPASFHLTNAALHALVSACVHALVRRQTASPTAAFWAGLLFALHPVHTEAVAGVVGRADLFAALCVLAALSAQQAALRAESRGEHGRAAAAAVLWLAAGCCSKDTGVTGVATLACYEALAYCTRAAAAVSEEAVAPPSHAAAAAAAAAALRRAGKRAAGRAAGSRRAVARLLSLVTLGAGYVGLRAWLTGGAATTTNVRRVENFLPFLETRLSRLLSIAHLHVLNARALLDPLAPLSVDWGVDCIQPVTTLSDPRNLASAALYTLLAYLLLAAQPWRPSADRSLLPARERACVAAGLLLAPFAPASNLLVYPATQLAERLLYLPSIGLCLLLARPLARLTGPLPFLEAPQAAAPRAYRGAAASIRVAAITSLLLLCAGRTALRVEDWRTEAGLFDAALRVCPRSAHMVLGRGVEAGRTGRNQEALADFATVREIMPDYCDVDYYDALVHMNLGHAAVSDALFEAALDCKGFRLGVRAAADLLLTRTEAVLEGEPHNVRSLLLRARLLGDAGQAMQACSLSQRAQAAAVATDAPKPLREAAEAAVAARCTRKDGASLGQCGAAVEEFREALLAANAEDAATPGHKKVSLIASSDHEMAQAVLVALSSVRGRAARAFLRSSGGCSKTEEAYWRTVYEAQTASPYDPYLQREWAAVLRATHSDGSRDGEAGQHEQLARLLFTRGADAAVGGVGEGDVSADEMRAEGRRGLRDEL